MKHLLQLLLNLFSWFIISFQSFWGILWYGKLPKLSYYHWVRDGSLHNLKDIYEDENIQVFKTNQVSDFIKKEIINDYINELFKNESFKANVAGVNIPLFNGKEIYGYTGINSILKEVREQYIKNNI